MDKNNFLVQMIFKDAVCNISDAAAGQVFKSLFRYVESGNIESLEDASAMGVFLCIKSSVDVALKKYDDKCMRNRENIQQRWGKKDNEAEKKTLNTNVYERIPSNTNVYECIPSNTNVYECIPNDNDDDNDDDNDNLSLSHAREKTLTLSEGDIESVIVLWNDVCINFPSAPLLTDADKYNRKRKIAAAFDYLSQHYGTTDVERLKGIFASIFHRVNESEKFRGLTHVKLDWVLWKRNLKDICEDMSD